MPVTSSYGVPGSATYSQDLGGLDQMMSALPDNTINQITAKNVRDSAFTMYNIIQGSIAANLTQVVAVGNTTSQAIQIGGLQVDGTASFGNSTQFLSTISDKNGLTGTNGYVITATNGGVIWAPQSGGISATPSLQQVLQAGNTASTSFIMYGNGIFNGASVFNASTSSTWAVAITKSLILSSTIQDASGATGPAGYILSATTNGVAWIPNTGGSGVNNLYQSTSLGNTTSNSIIITNPSYSAGIPRTTILLSATMGYIMSFTGSSTYGTLYYGGLIYQNSTNTYRINTPASYSNITTALPIISGTFAVMSQLTLDSVLAIGNTSSLYASIGGLSVIGTASFGTSSFSGLLTLSNGLIVTGTSSFNSNLSINGGLSVYSTASFVGTASFAKGIIDNYNSPGTASYVLTIDATGKVKWETAVADLQFRTITSTSSYTLVLTDNQRMISVTSSTMTIITIPTYASVAFNNGSYITITQYGTGGVNITPASGVTIHSKSGYLSIGAQFVTVTLTKMSTNAWLLTGDLAP